MSIEMHVLFRGKLPNKTALQRVMTELGFPFTFQRYSGRFWMRFGGQKCSIAYEVYNGKEIVQDFIAEGVAVDPAFDRRLIFRGAEHPVDVAAVRCAAASLAKFVNGVVFDPRERKVISAEGAIDLAWKDLPAPTSDDAAKSLGTRPQHLKRLLKPLLDLRPDLALVGRRLIVRPVRHVMRGVYLDHSALPYRLEIYRYFNPLYAEPRSYLGEERIDGPWEVYEPYFEPILFDVLGEDIFSIVGRASSLLDYAHAIGRRPYTGVQQIVTLLLAGEREQAAVLAAKIERGEVPVPVGAIEQCRDLLAQDPAQFYAIHHALEAANAKRLKLDQIWEPSPFPGELPASERSSRDEHKFEARPWIAAPDHLWEPFPEGPGDIRFCELTHWRNGRLILYCPLSREQAEERHRAGIGYVLAIRLPDNRQLVLQSHSTRNPHYPIQPTIGDTDPVRRIDLWIHGPETRVEAKFRKQDHAEGMFELWGVEIWRGHEAKIFTSFVWPGSSHIAVWDNRAGARQSSKVSLSETDVAQYAFPAPEFGDFRTLLQCVSDHLVRVGMAPLIEMAQRRDSPWRWPRPLRDFVRILISRKA